MRSQSPESRLGANAGGTRIVGIEGRGALGAELTRRLFEAFVIASGEDDAGALGTGTPSGFKTYARAAANDDDGLAEQFRPGPIGAR